MPRDLSHAPAEQTASLACSDEQCHWYLHGSSNSTKSPASGTATVSQPRLMSQAGRVHVAQVCFCGRSGGDASILAGSFEIEWHIGSKNTGMEWPGHCRDTRWSVLPTLCSNGKWVGQGGHLTTDTRWLLSRDWGTVPYGLWDKRLRLTTEVV